MVKTNPLLYHLKNAVDGLIQSFFIVFLLLFVSCSRDKITKEGYSEAFKPVFAKVTIFFGTDEVDEGLRYLDSAVSNISDPNIDDKFRTYGFHYAYWHKFKGDNKKALLYADSMLMFANEGIHQKKYVSNVVEANMALGDAYFDLQQYDKAYQHYFEGYQLGKNNLDNRAISDYNYRMGMISYKMGQF